MDAFFEQMKNQEKTMIKDIKSTNSCSFTDKSTLAFYGILSPDEKRAVRNYLEAMDEGEGFSAESFRDFICEVILHVYD